jgi:asparagine N-glycosylation enzyme membrane subunit Stt3
MKKNVGNTDKIIRLVIAVALIALYFTGKITGALGIVGLVVAAVFAVTSFAGTCPIYSILGASTCPVKEN